MDNTRASGTDLLTGSATSAAGGGGKLPEWKDKHYLIIDDYQGMRQLLREALRSLGARFIDQADSGGNAIAQLATTRYDVVFCDYNLGAGKNGQQVLEEAKLRELISPTTVWMMVSAEKSVESVMGAAEFQPDAYLIKPITEEVLLSRLNRAWIKKQIFKKIDMAYKEKDYLKAAKLCDEQAQTDKLHGLELMRMRAGLLIKAGEPALARAVYERVLADRDYAWAKTGLAKIMLQEGDYGTAKRMFTDVIAENQHYLDAYDQLALSHQQLGEFDDAERTLERAAKLSPNSMQRQRSLGEASLKNGNIAAAEKSFRKCISLGEHSALKTADAYLGLARVCGQKNEPKEALALLALAAKEFDSEELRLRAKITEGLVYHESGDYRRARKAGDELAVLLENTTERADTKTSLDMARLMFAVGVKEAPVDLLKDIIKNNHDNTVLSDEVQSIFEKGRMGEEGASLIAGSRKEATEMMNKGVQLWMTGKLAEAVEWTRTARTAMPTNVRILFNCAHILIAFMAQFGSDTAMFNDARELLLTADKIAPGQKRFAQLMEQLLPFAPVVAPDVA